MTAVFDEVRGVRTSVLACRVCGKPVYFSVTQAGKRCPYDVDDDGQATRTSHFTTCVNVRRWTDEHPRQKADKS
jgi:hypothetical protein